MTRDRDEVLAEMQPLRKDMISLGEHLMDEHGVSATNPASTDPKTMENDVARVSWMGRFAPEEGWRLRVEEGLDLSVKAARTELYAAITTRQDASCGLKNCPGVGKLLSLHKERRTKRDALREEMPDADGGGQVLEIRPHGLSVDQMTGMLGA